MAFSFKRQYRADWRFELKYRMTPMQYHRVKSALLPYMESDSYTEKSHTGRYLVRSLYFDTSRYQSYHEKMEGDYGRIKARIRSYSSTDEGGTPLRVELKTRRGSAMEKHSCFVTASDCAHFLKDWHWPVLDNLVLIEFERLLHLRALRPKVLVEYEREGLRTRSRDDLRITFDHEVRSASASAVFPERPFFRAHHRHVVIMEIKCRLQQPAWLTALVKDHGLKFVANSKYTRAIEVARPDVVTPSWNFDPELLPEKISVERVFTPGRIFRGGAR